MPLVYVHGVNNRRGDTAEERKVYDRRVDFMKEQFRRAAFAERVEAADGLAVFAPYWGDLGVSFARDLACLPQGGVQELAVGQPEAAALQAATAANLDPEILRQRGVKDAPLLTLARGRSLGAALDLLFAGAANAPVPANLLGDAEVTSALPAAAIFADAAERYAAANRQPGWLAGINDDDTFLAKLAAEVFPTPFPAPTAPIRQPGVQPLAIGNTLKSWLSNAAAAVRGVVGSIVDTGKITATQTAREGFLVISGFVRPAASALLGRFFGDVFTYLENRQPILDRVLADVDKALKARRDGDSELYLVGHSFGGIILYDILTVFRPDLVCDLYVTVGSQVALFAEIDRLADKKGIARAFAAGPQALAPRPTAAKRWLNIFDSTDFFGFGTRGVFAGVRDFRYNTDALPLVSHGAYFDTPRFFGRLRERTRDAFEQGTDTPT
jgi:hypothetical protein